CDPDDSARGDGGVRSPSVSMIADVNGRESVLSDDLEDLLVRTPRHRSPVLARSRLLNGLLLCAISGVGVVDAPGAARRREVRSFDGDPRTADVRNASSSRGGLRHSAPVVQAGRLEPVAACHAAAAPRWTT